MMFYKLNWIWHDLMAYFRVLLIIYINVASVHDHFTQCERSALRGLQSRQIQGNHRGRGEGGRGKQEKTQMHILLFNYSRERGQRHCEKVCFRDFKGTIYHAGMLVGNVTSGEL